MCVSVCLAAWRRFLPSVLSLSYRAVRWLLIRVARRGTIAAGDHLPPISRGAAELGDNHRRWTTGGVHRGAPGSTMQMQLSKDKPMHLNPMLLYACMLLFESMREAVTPPYQTIHPSIQPKDQLCALFTLLLHLRRPRTTRPAQMPGVTYARTNRPTCVRQE